MTYLKQNFKDGNVLSASHLNYIEDGIFYNVANSLKGKVISILGDSISTFDGYIPIADGHNLKHRARYPQDNLLTNVEETWWHKLITNLGAKLGINDSWAGSRVHNSATANSGDQGPDACMASITRITNLGANGTPDIILFYGGTNDAGGNVTIGNFDSSQNYTSVDLTSNTWSTFADAYKTAIMRLQYYYPNAKIICLLPMWTTSYYTIANMDAYGEVVKEICDYFGVPVIDLRKCGINWQNKNYTLGDGIHPTARGMALMEAYIRRQLLSYFEGDYTDNIVYSITNNLTNITNKDRYIKGVSKNTPYKATLTGDVSKLSIRVKGQDITEEVFNEDSMTIQIPSVEGDVIIDELGGPGYIITYNYQDEQGNIIKNPTYEKVEVNTVLTFSEYSAPYIEGYEAISSSIAGEYVVDQDIIITYIYKIGKEIVWYVDHRNNGNIVKTDANIAGRGWTLNTSNPAYEAILNKPINTWGFFTNKQQQTLVIMKISSKNASEGEVIATVTATSVNNLAIVSFPTVILQDGEYLAIGAQDDNNIHLFYTTSSVIDANGLVDLGFHSRVPKVYEAGTAWTDYTSGTFAWSFGYREE